MASDGDIERPRNKIPVRISKTQSTSIVQTPLAQKVCLGIRTEPHSIRIKEVKVKKSNNIGNNVNKQKEDKFEQFVNKVNEVGDKFKANNNNVKHNNNHSKIDKKWEETYNNLGKAQQENIDLLQHQAEQFEIISKRINNALNQTNDESIFQEKFSFITKQTKYLEDKLNDLQSSITKKANDLETNVKNALNKYKDMENISDLISVGIINDDPDKDKDDHDVIMKDEEKLSFLYEISESNTGFNYNDKRNEIKNIINDVLDCKHKIDQIDKINIKKRSDSYQQKMNNNININDDINDVEIESDQQFMDRISNRIKSTVEMLEKYTPKIIEPSLNVHWKKDVKQLHFIPIDHKQESKPKSKSKSTKTLKSNQKSKIQPKQCKHGKIKPKTNVVHRTTQRPPELQFNSKPMSPPKIKFRPKPKPKLKPKQRKSYPKPIFLENKIFRNDNAHNNNNANECSMVYSSFGIQTKNIIQNSIEQDIKSMASHNEEQDQVNIFNDDEDISSETIVESIIDDIIAQSILKAKADESTSKQIEYEQELVPIIHISPSKHKKEEHKQEKEAVQDKKSTMIHSPICKEYNVKLAKLQQRINSISPNKSIHGVDEVKSYPVSSTASTSTSIASSTISMNTSLSTDSSFDLESSSSSSDSEDDYDDLKESLNRQWNEIQMTLNNLEL